MNSVEARRIVCSSCQAQYRVPETVTSSSVRCKRCGAEIPLDAAPAVRPVTSAHRRSKTGARRTTGRSSGPGSAASEAVRARGRRTQIAMGMRTKASPSALYVLSGILLLGLTATIVVLAS